MHAGVRAAVGLGEGGRWWFLFLGWRGVAGGRLECGARLFVGEVVVVVGDLMQC